MPRLTDTQTTLLSTAAARPDGSVLPPPETLKVKGASLERSLQALLRHGLIAQAGGVQQPLSGKRTAKRSEADSAAALIITPAGLEAIGIDPSGVDDRALDGDAAAPAPDPGGVETARPGGKLGLMLDLVSAPSGATLDELAARSGWQPHTTRAALTRLRQRGFGIQLTDVGERRAYRLSTGA